LGGTDLIYLVDEDVSQLSAFADELRFRGYNVKQIENADDAYSWLVAAQDVQLVIIDVMLGTLDPDTSRFSRDKTLDFLTTGLALIKDLVDHDPDKFKHKLVLFTMTSTPNLVMEVQHASQEYHAPFLRKRDYVSPYSFGTKIEEILSGTNPG
jgi:ActR/RegA family two-component response regulator